MKTIIANSTTLHAIDYDAEHHILQIEFQNRSVYQYFHVPATVYEELLRAPSKGAYFNRNIRPRFDCSQVKAGSLS